MTAHARLQVRRPAATQQMAPRKQRASFAPDQARGGELQHSAVSNALNAGPAVQRLARIQARVNAPRQPARQETNTAAELKPASDTAQRVFMLGADGNNIQGLSRKAQANWAAALRYLNAMGQNVAPDIVGTLRNTDEGGTNPAYTNPTAATPNTDARIDVAIKNWYLEMASTGELMGMLAHELGVHTLADAEMTQQQKTAETNTNHLGEQVQVGGTNYALAGQQGGDARQIDHVNAVKRQAGGQLRARGERYLQTFLRMGDAIEADNTIDAAEKTRRQRDMLKTFLFDIGRILATDDAGVVRGYTGVPGATVMASGSIAEVMNWYRDTYLQPQYGAHNWLAQFNNEDASGVQVAAMLVDKLADYGVARVKTASPTTQKVLGAAGVGALAAGVAFAPATTLVLGVAGLGYGLYRYFAG
ncbi:MAG: hypothetical protein HY244_12730 [Rhizobiales bacterium]|nr:hypothetical protein [Hyphomicrobiales bacterium]